MVDRALVERKLSRIEGYLRELRGVSVGNLEDFQSDVVVRRFVERQIELSVEQMIDVCRHLVAGLHLPEPETYAHCFELLATAGVVPDESLSTFKSMARFRNLLIHGYDDIDDAVTYGVYSKRLGDFTSFITAIRNYLNQ